MEGETEAARAQREEYGTGKYQDAYAWTEDKFRNNALANLDALSGKAKRSRPSQGPASTGSSVEGSVRKLSRPSQGSSIGWLNKAKGWLKHRFSRQPRH